ncbi:hypothetical protein [Salinimicrobium marinum]|nr:hypothetical protein [Salinimicrobium marinum]
MIKCFFTLIAIFFCNVDVWAQIHDGGNHGLMTVTLKKNENMNSVEGSPYLNDEFQPGTALVNEKEPLSVFLRYDVSREIIEIKTEIGSNEIFMLPSNQETEYRIAGDTFIYDNFRFEDKQIKGYFKEHFSGERYRLLEKPTLTITEPVAAKTGYEKDRPAEIVLDEEFFVISNDGEVKNVKLKQRDVKKVFTSNAAKKYLKGNKIRSIEDLAAFVAYLDRN